MTDDVPIAVKDGHFSCTLLSLTDSYGNSLIEADNSVRISQRKDTSTPPTKQSFAQLLAKADNIESLTDTHNRHVYG